MSLCDKWMGDGCILAHTMHPETSEEHLCQVFLWVGVMMASTTLVAITMPKKVAWVLRLGGRAGAAAGPRTAARAAGR